MIEALVCPVDDCEWQHVRMPPPVNEEALANVFGRGVYRAVALAQELNEAERATREHMAGHTAEEFLRTITRLQRELAAALPVSAASAWTSTTSDRLETAAQLLHLRRHRLGTSSTCDRCRREVAELAAILAPTAARSAGRDG